MKFRLYAFKSKERTELLKDHIQVGLKVIRELYIDEGYHRHIARRVASVGAKLETWEAEAIIYMAYIYHDSGKAVEPFQSMIRKGRGAPGHEVLSAYLAAVVLKRWCKFPEDVNVGIPLAILLHMGALRHYFESITILEKRGLASFQLTREAIQEFNQIISYSWPMDVSPPVIQEKDIKLRRNELLNFIKEEIFKGLPSLKYGRLKEESKRRWLLTYMVLHPLLIADEYAVAKNTGQKPRPWAKEFAETTRALHRLRGVGGAF